MIKKIDHIAIGVKDVDQAAAFYRDVLGLPVSEPEIVESQKVKVVMVPVGEVKIELMQPTSEESPLHKQIEKGGEGIKHICFGVEEIHQAHKTLSEKDVPLVNPEPISGAHNTLAFFVHPKATNRVLLEMNMPKDGEAH